MKGWTALANARGTRSTVKPETWVAPLLLLGTILLTGWALKHGAFAAIAVGLTPIVLALLVFKPWTRSIAVVGGGLVILGSSSDVGPAKIAYSAVLLVCTVVAVIRLSRDPPQWGVTFKPSIVLGVLLFTSMILGTIGSSGQTVVDIARQSLFYLIIPVAPILGIDAGMNARSAVVHRWVCLAGTISAVGFATDWLSRRGVSTLPIQRFVVPSVMLPTLAFALSFILFAFTSGWGKLGWSIPVLVIPSAMLVTGTRTNLVIFAAIIGLVGATERFRLPFRSALLITVGCIASAAALVPLAASWVISNPDFLRSRVAALQAVLAGAGVTDASYTGRLSQYAFAELTIRQYPWFGLGPGYVPPTSLDTPLSTVVRLGIVGSVCLLGFLISVVRITVQLERLSGPSPMLSAARGAVVVFVFLIPFGSPVEDHGFGFALILLFAGVSAHASRSSATEPDHIMIADLLHVTPHAISAHSSGRRLESAEALISQRAR